jgi:dipeptidyl aminopeptidase/acylaminoacyl peptidase
MLLIHHRKPHVETLETRLLLSAPDPAIAFVNTYTANRAQVSELTVINADGSHRAVIWRSAVSGGGLSSPAMSPDLDNNPTNGYQGSIVVVRDARWDGRNTSDLWIVPLVVTANGVHGETPRLLATNALDPSWSPRGDLIAYAASSATFDGIAVISPDGTTVPKTLVFPVPDPSIEGVNRPTWNPDGTRLAFVYFGQGSVQNRLWVKEVLDPQTGELIVSGSAREVVPAGWLGSSLVIAPDWSKGGTRIAFEISSKSDEIYTVDVDAAQPLDTLRAVPGTKSSGSPTWSPDDPNTPQDETDRFLVFEQAGAQSKIVRIDLDSGTKSVLAANSKDNNRWPDWRHFPVSAAPSTASSDDASGRSTPADFDAALALFLMEDAAATRRRRSANALVGT